MSSNASTKEQKKSSSISPYLLFFGGLVFLVIAFTFLALLYTKLSYLYSLLLGMNGALFVLCGIDKAIAGSKETRVPELVFYIGALLGGSVGLLTGMKLFRHKTSKPSFLFFLVLVIAVQLVLLKYYVLDVEGLNG